MDLNKHDLTPLKKALGSEFSVYTVEIENPGVLETSMEPLKVLMNELDISLHDHQVSLSSDNFRMYMGPKSGAPSSFYQFGTHVLAGRMPFLFYKNDDGKILGCLLKLEFHQRDFDPKVISKKIMALVEETRATPKPVSYKEAKKVIQDELKSGKKPHEFPIIERHSSHYIYFDFENERMLIKNSQRNSSLAHHSVMFCNKFAAQMVLDGIASPGLQDSVEKTTQFRPMPVSFAMNCIREGVTDSAFKIHNLVDFYAQKKEPAPVQATDSAELRVADSDSQKLQFKDSLSTIAARDIGTEDHFQTLKRFATSKQCEVTSLTVLGEIKKPGIIKKYLEVFPEGTYDAIEGDYIELRYHTKSVQGNITFSTRAGVDLVADAAERLIRNEIGESGADFNFTRAVCSKWFGQMLGVLHASSDLFVACYLEASATKSEFAPAGEEKAA